MPATRLEDREIEQLLSRSAEVPDDLADLEEFISVMSSGIEAPRDVEHMATSLAAVARASGRPRRSGFRRLAILTASMAILFAFSGIAMAADGAAPGDALYTVDTALERVGIGAGGVEERIEEFEDLRGRDAETEAYSFLAEYIGSADDVDARIASEHLLFVESEVSPNAQEAQEKVTAILAFIVANKGELDGRDFGLGVAAIARGESTDPGKSNSATEPGNAEDQGSNGRPDDAGTTDQPPATPDEGSEQPDQNEAPGQTKDPGPPDDAPDETGPPDEGPSNEKPPRESPGDTAPGATKSESGKSNGNSQGQGNS